MNKDELKKTKIGQVLLVLKRAYQFPEYRQWLSDFEDSHTFFKFQELGNLNSDKTLYIINDIYASSGFFYSWCQVCRGLMVAERYGFTPVVDWSKGPYYDEKGYNGYMNPFEYYFEPVSQVSLAEALQSRNVTFYNWHTNGGAFALYSYRNDEEINRFARINAKYLHIHEEIYSRLCEEIRSLLGERKTLAVHVRGVEWGEVKDHPIPTALEEYANCIDTAITEHEFVQIFLATDSEDTVAFFKNRYEDRVVCYKDVVRAKKGSHTLAIFEENLDRENNGFLLGYEVLKDMLTISFCDGIVAGLSYVSFAAEVFKRSRGDSYQYKSFVKQALCKRGITPEKFMRRIKGRS